MARTITVASTLASIVNEHPDLARELERRYLDYCCGGERTLAEACEQAGIDPVSTAEALSRATDQPRAEWADLEPAALVDHLEATHHAYLHDELPRLSALARKVVGVHGTRHPELTRLEQVYDALRADLEPHLAKEERVLFPMIRELASTGERPPLHRGSIQRPISMMLIEHDRAGELLAELRRISDDYAPPPDACASFTALYDGLRELEADTHLHVHKENNLLFPAVLNLDSRLDPANG
jgi:regulator of cell morphogenesis and NO signaling